MSVVEVSTDKNNQVEELHPLESKKVGALLWQYSVPAVIATISSSLYNLADRAFIGQGVGPLAISGLTLTLPIMVLIQAFGTLIGVGSATRISIFLGMKYKGMAERVLGNAIVLTFVIWSCICLFSIPLMDQLLTLFGGSEQTIPYAREYLLIMIPGSIFINLAYSFSNVIRASGNPKTAMGVILLGVGLNLILDPLFIFVFDWGIQGAAWASVIAMAISAYVTLRFFSHKNSTIRFRKENIRIDSFIVGHILSIGLAPFFINLAASVVNILVNNQLVKYGGDLAIGAFGIINSYAMFFVMLVIGLCQGMQPIAGYNYGAGHWKRVRKVLSLSLWAGSIITTVAFLTAMFFPDAMARVFTSDSELIRITRMGIFWIFFMFPLVGFQIVSTQFFQSIGKAHISIFLSLTRQVLFLIPAVLVCPRFWGLVGVFRATTIADCCSIMVTMTMLFFQLKKMDRQYTRI